MKTIKCLKQQFLKNCWYFDENLNFDKENVKTPGANFDNQLYWTYLI